MEQKLTFTAYLKDEYSKRFDQLAEHSDKAIKGIAKDLDKLATTGKKAARSIDDIDRRIKVLSQAKKFTLDTSAIKYASQEIKALQREKQKLEGGSAGGGGMFGGMSKGFAVAGGAMAIVAGLQQVGAKAVDATAKYQRYEAVLTNALGSAGQAKDTMQMITDVASSTPFQVDELTASFVKLQSQGFKPTRDSIIKLGDLAASMGKPFDMLSEAVLDARQGEFERLKEFGIKARVDGDKIGMSFKGQTTFIKKGTAAMDEYLLSLGSAKGVTGAMAAISKTTGGAVSNLDDNFDLLYKTIGDRFKPEIDSSIGLMNSMVTSVRSWFDIPLSKKLQEESDKLSTLRTELGFTNVSEQRRKEILEEVKRIQPDIIDGTKSEKEQMEGLTIALDSYINKRKEQIAFQKVTEQYSDSIVGYNKARQKSVETSGEELAAITMANRLGFKSDGMTQGQASAAAQNFLKDRIKRGVKTDVFSYTSAGSGMGYGGTTQTSSAEERALQALRGAVARNKSAGDDANKFSSGFNEAMQAKSNIEKLLGTGKPGETLPAKSGDMAGGGKGGNKSGSSSGSSMGSISGGSKVTHLNIAINNLVGGGVNIHSSTVREGATKMKDIVVEALLTGVNDANLAAN